MDIQDQKQQTQPNWLIFFLFLLFISQKDTKKLTLEGMNLIDLDKKTKFLNRIKGYMDPEEQYVIHSAETLLQIIRNVKVLMEPPQIASAGVRYSSFSLEDRKRNMFIDLSEFLEEEKKILVHQAVDFDVKVRTIEKKLKEIHSLSKNEHSIANIYEYIEVLEPVLTDEVKEKIHEMKKLISVVNVIGTLRNKDQLNEMDLLEIIQPFMPKGQGESLMRMVQIFKVISSMKDDDTATEDEAVEEKQISEKNHQEVIENVETSEEHQENITKDLI